MKIYFLLVIIALAMIVVLQHKTIKQYKSIIVGKNRIVAKFEKFYWTLVNWLEVRQDGYKLDEWFIKRGYKKIAIYGAKELGERLYEELKGSPVEVSCFIDRNKDINMSNEKVRVFLPEAIPEDIDVIVVTAIYYYTDIADSISKTVKCPVVSLEAVVDEL